MMSASTNWIILIVLLLSTIPVTVAKGCVDPQRYWNTLLEELNPTQALKDRTFDVEADTNCVNAAERVLRISRNEIYKSQTNESCAKCTYPPVDWAYQTLFDPDLIDYTKYQWEFPFQHIFQEQVLWDIQAQTEEMLTQIQETLKDITKREGSYHFLDFQLPNSDHGVHHRWVVEIFNNKATGIRARLYQSFFGHFSLQKWLEPWVAGARFHRQGWSNHSNPILSQSGLTCQGSSHCFLDTVRREILGQHSWRERDRKNYDKTTAEDLVYHWNETQLRQYMDVLYLYLRALMEKFMEDVVLFHAFEVPQNGPTPQCSSTNGRRILNEDYDQYVNLSQCIDEYMAYYSKDETRQSLIQKSKSLLNNPDLFQTSTRQKQSRADPWKGFLEHLHQWNTSSTAKDAYRQRFTDCQRRSELDTPTSLGVGNKRQDMMYATMFLFGPLALCTKLPVPGNHERHVFHFRVINTTLCDHSSPQAKRRQATNLT